VLRVLRVPFGIGCALATAMPVRDHRELIVWQLADELRRRIVAFVAKTPACRDRRFCDQIQDAIGDVCRDITEGFYRYTHGEIAKYMGYARSSTGEIQDLIVEADEKQYVAKDEAGELARLGKRLSAGLASLRRYHRAAADEEKRRTPRRRRRRAP
jgi:four helix bundle protein